jgi:hypothetical protein
MVVVVLIVTVVSILAAVMVGLCAAGRIGRNPIVGLRLPALFASDEAWTSGHRAGVLPTVSAAAICVVAAIVVAVFPSLAMIGTYVVLIVLVAGVVMAGVVGSRAAG